MNNRTHTSLAAMAYAIGYYFVYLDYLAPIFGYAHYNLIRRPFIFIVFSIGVAVIPTVFYQGCRKISTFIAILIYATAYVPSIITIMLALDRPVAEILIIQITFMMGMSLFFLADRFENHQIIIPNFRQWPLSVFHSLAITLTILVLFKYHNDLRFVSFDEVYNHRFANTETDRGALVGYSVMWLTSCVYPIYLAIGLTIRRWRFFIVGSAGLTLIYMATASKTSLLTPIIVLAFYFASKLDINKLLPRILTMLTTVSITLLYVLPKDNLIVYWTRAILLMRTLSTGGWSSFTYYDYFPKHGFTYYSHIRIVDFFTHMYPYHPFELGQVIGLEYSDSELANFNANFWATDGIAAMGIPGIIIINFIVFIFLIAINKITSRHNLSFVIIALTPFIMTLLNISFFTALLSGGGFMFVIVFLVFDFTKNNLTSKMDTNPLNRSTLNVSQK